MDKLLVSGYLLIHSLILKQKRKRVGVLERNPEYNRGHE